MAMAGNKLVMRRNQNVFMFYTPQGIKVGMIYMGEIREYNKDQKCLKAIETALCERWGLSTGKK